MRPNALHKWGFRLILALNIGLALSLVGLGIMSFQQGIFWRADFSTFYMGGALVRDGLGRQLYDFDIQTRYQRQILEGKSFLGGLLPFNNPPHNALLFSILARFPLATSYGIQILVQLALLTALLRVLWRFSQAWDQRERVLLISGVLAFYPLLVSILLGAFSLLVLLCFLLWFQALKEKRDAAAGLWLLPTSLKPQTAAIPGLLMLFARRWRALIAAAIGAAGIMLFTAIWLGPGIWIDFIKVLRLSSTFFDEYGIYPSTMYNLKGTLVLWLGNQREGLINTLSLIGFLLSIGATWWLWRGDWQPERPDFALRMAISLTLGVLFSLHVNPQDGLLLVAPAILFYAYLRQKNLPRQAFGIFLCFCPLLFLLSEFTLQDRLGIRLPVVAMLVLLGWQVQALWVSTHLLTVKGKPT